MPGARLGQHRKKPVFQVLMNLSSQDSVRLEAQLLPQTPQTGRSELGHELMAFALALSVPSV